LLLRWQAALQAAKSAGVTRAKEQAVAARVEAVAKREDVDRQKAEADAAQAEAETQAEEATERRVQADKKLVEAKQVLAGIDEKNFVRFLHLELIICQDRLGTNTKTKIGFYRCGGEARAG
jgi:FKBP-type peptidyl-prolyl cis-trans isomerase